MPNNLTGKFSLQEILAENPEWDKQIREDVKARLWHDIKSSSITKKLSDLNERVESVEQRLARFEDVLIEIRNRLNGGSTHG